MYHPLTQTDSDEERDRRSLATGIQGGDEDPTRQEHKDEADINYLMKRYGQVPGTGRPVQFGEQLDFDFDLMRAFEALSDARSSYDKLPDRLRAKYPSIESLMTALESGELELTPDSPRSEAPDGNQEPQSGAPAGAPPAKPPA